MIKLSYTKCGVEWEAEFETLADAMKAAQKTNEFVTIDTGTQQIVGHFGADEVIDGILPNGDLYEWKMRR